MALDEKVYKAANVHSKISMAKNHLISPEEYLADGEVRERDKRARMPELGKIYAAYVNRCRRANAMDFDDLLVYTYILFREHDDVRKKWASHFEYVLVDEYQDTNYAQQLIVLQLTKEGQRICAVGDDSQSIYSFRGANIDNILDFQSKFQDTKLFKLEQNYRSTQRIVQAANSLIKKNSRQIPKEVFSENAEGEKLVLKSAYSDKEEALIVCREIKKIKRKDSAEWSDFAILYRTNSQSRSFEEEMRKQNIPYRIYGGLSFYQRKEIKDIIAYFRLVSNPDDEEAFKRIINYPARGIGQTTLGKIAMAAREHSVSFWEVLREPVHYGLNVNKGTLTKLDKFRVLIQKFIEEMPVTDVYQLGQALIKESGISTDIYSESSPEAISRQENLEEFVGSLQDFVEERKEEDRGNQIYLPDFLQEVSLLTDQDSDDDTSSKVVLMTVHAAKGLEFPTVFVVGLEENIFPSPMSSDTIRGLEEERRLLYVAITRAEKHCILTCAKNRWRYGKVEFDTPSRFIKDIDDSLLNIEGEDASSASHGYHYENDSPRHYQSSFKENKELPEYMRNIRQPGRFPQIGGNFKKVKTVDRPTSTSVSSASDSIDLHVGNVIEHQRFGIGKVIDLVGTGENMKATVEFKNSGKKQLLLKFAKYTVVG
jgi:DNA helicase-2/ATP-dependent DNA helicase PcrA